MYRQLTAIEIVDDDDREMACLLLAHLASLLDGVEPGHIDALAFEALTAGFRAELVGQRFLDARGIATGAPLRAAPLWNCFRHAVSTVAEQAHSGTGNPYALSDTRDPDPDHEGHRTGVISSRLACWNQDPKVAV